MTTITTSTSIPNDLLLVVLLPTPNIDTTRLASTDVGHLVGLQAVRSFLHQGGVPKIEEFQLARRCEPDIPRMQICMYPLQSNFFVTTTTTR